MSTNIIQFPTCTHTPAPVKPRTRKKAPPEMPMPEGDGWLDMNEYLITNQDQTHAVRICGDDAENGIYSGDVLIVDRSVKPRKGDLVLYNEDGQFITRRFVSSHLKLAGDEYEDMEAARVFGVVIHHIHTLRRIEPPTKKRGMR